MEKRGGVLVFVGLNRTLAVPMVILLTPFGSRAEPPFHRVRIVDTNQSGAIRCVQGQRIFETVGPSRLYLSLDYDKLHPVSLPVQEQRLAVKKQQCVETWIMEIRRHRNKLSFIDNTMKG